MHRFFVERGTTSDERFAVPARIDHQVRRVLRLHDGDQIILLEGDGNAVHCRLDGRHAVVVDRRPISTEPKHRLTLCQALIKGDGLEQVVQHGTEVGVAAFRLFVSERCVMRELSDHRLERLRSVAREAAEQSERGLIPLVAAPQPLASMPMHGSVLLFERHDGDRLSELAPPQALLVGPEGGFASHEVSAARAMGAALASLGPRILRSESVAVAATAVVLSRAGDFA